MEDEKTEIYPTCWIEGMIYDSVLGKRSAESILEKEGAALSFEGRVYLRNVIKEGVWAEEWLSELRSKSDSKHQSGKPRSASRKKVIAHPPR